MTMVVITLKSIKYFFIKKILRNSKTLSLAESVDYIFKNKGQEIISDSKNESKEVIRVLPMLILKISKT